MCIVYSFHYDFFFLLVKFFFLIQLIDYVSVCLSNSIAILLTWSSQFYVHTFSHVVLKKTIVLHELRMLCGICVLSILMFSLKSSALKIPTLITRHHLIHPFRLQCINEICKLYHVSKMPTQAELTELG